MAERREDFDPELARVARILITSLELEVPGSETPEPASEAQAEDETP